MTSEVYRANGGQRILSWVVFGFMVLIGVPLFISALFSGNVGTIVFMVVWVSLLAFNAWRFLGSPREIVVTSECIRFVGWRSRDVPWIALRSVDSPSYDFNRFMLQWKWDGGKITTVGGFQGQRRLLNSVEAHAPHARIDA